MGVEARWCNRIPNVVLCLVGQAERSVGAGGTRRCMTRAIACEQRRAGKGEKGSRPVPKPLVSLCHVLLERNALIAPITTPSCICVL